MTTEQMKNEMLYDSAMIMARRLRSEGIVTAEEYAVFEARMRAKYAPEILVLYSDMT